MNRSISNQDYADLFNDGLPWRENNYKIDFSQFLSIMKRLNHWVSITIYGFMDFLGGDPTLRDSRSAWSL